MYYTYVLRDKGVPFYVGKGTKDRAYQHERIVKDEIPRDHAFGITHDYNPHLTRKIKKILRENRQIEYEFALYTDKETEAFEKEKELIKKYGRAKDGGTLTNIHPGGIGGDVVSRLSPEAKARRAEKLRIAWKSKSEEERQKIIARQKETKRKLDNGTANGGTYHSQITREKMKLRTGPKNPLFGRPSPKRGKPATGGNAKGVRQAWNKGVDKNDPRAIKHREAVRKYRAKNAPRPTMQYKLVDPDGNIVEGVGMKSLTENYDVSPKIRRLIHGKVNYYKGWRRA